MSVFDDAWSSSVEAEIDEMGELGYIRESLDADDYKEVMGVRSDAVKTHTQSVGGKRDIATFSFFVKEGDAEGVEKGYIIEVDGEQGRVLSVEDLDGGGAEIKCGAISSWRGSVPGV